MCAFRAEEHIKRAGVYDENPLAQSDDRRLDRDVFSLLSIADATGPISDPHRAHIDASATYRHASAT